MSHGTLEMDAIDDMYRKSPKVFTITKEEVYPFDPQDMLSMSWIIVIQRELIKVILAWCNTRQGYHNSKYTNSLNRPQNISAFVETFKLSEQVL